MKDHWENISFADLITERKDRFDPDASEIMGLPKIEKIDFSEGNLHLGQYEPTKTQQIIVEPGDFVFSGLNIEKGAAGFNETGDRLVVSANYSTCSYNDSRVSLDFFKHYMRSENFQKLLKENLKKDYGFTRPKHLMPLTFLVPRDKKQQERILNEYEKCKKTHLKFSAEITRQQTLIAKLKQAILQEAIQGKLTEDWRASHPDVEPASQLLLRIQAEKSRLIATKKLRPEKPLPKITPAEISFEIPEGWEWCPLAAVMILRDGERNPISKAERERRGKGFPYYGASGVIDEIDGFTHDGDFLLVGEDGSNLRLRSTPVAFGASGKIWVNNHAHVLEFIEPVLQEFVAHRINGMDIAPFVTGGFQPKLSQENMNRIPIPLPPLAEQAAIVERVEALMITCRALEAEIEQSRTHAAHLLQAVLKEAFAPAES